MVITKILQSQRVAQRPISTDALSLKDGQLNLEFLNACRCLLANENRLYDGVVHQLNSMYNFVVRCTNIVDSVK